MAVGVASTRAQGQNTTRIVTARIISPEISQVSAAALKAITTIQVAQLSVIPTIFGLPYHWRLHLQLFYQQEGILLS